MAFENSLGALSPAAQNMARLKAQMAANQAANKAKAAANMTALRARMAPKSQMRFTPLVSAFSEKPTASIMPVETKIPGNPVIYDMQEEAAEQAQAEHDANYGIEAQAQADMPDVEVAPRMIPKTSIYNNGPVTTGSVVSDRLMSTTTTPFRFSWRQWFAERLAKRKKR